MTDYDYQRLIKFTRVAITLLLLLIIIALLVFVFIIPVQVIANLLWVLVIMCGAVYLTIEVME